MTYEACETCTTVETKAHVDLLAPLRDAVAAIKEALERRRIVHQLYQLDAHVLRDMGFYPERIYRAREGGIGETSLYHRGDSED